MPSKSKQAHRCQRRHDVFPAGFRWRDGRPRWDPSPTRRQQGWRAVDLRDERGSWLTKGAAIDRSQVIADAVLAWTRGDPVPANFAAFAPAGATVAGAGFSDLHPRSIGALLDGYCGNGDLGVEPCPRFAALAAKTQSDYRSKLKRFLETLVASKDPAKIEAARALDIDELLPPAFGEAGEFELERAYETLREETGDSMASGVHAAVSAWLAWCVKKKRVWATNPAELVERATPDGRIVVFDWPEVVALVGQAEAAGLASIADAIILAVDLSWSQQDLLSLNWGQFGAGGHVKHRRIKTGVAGNPPLLAIGRARVEIIRARWQDATVRPTHVIICEMTGKPWAADTFRHKFSEIRAEVAKTLPAVADKQFRDLRDTAVTYCIDAGLQVEQICSRTLHNPTRAQAVISKHYGAIRQGVADQAAAKLESHFAAMGYNFDAPTEPAAEG